MTGPKQPVSVAGIEFDALIESTENYSASVPQYPIDEGYSVSDNVALEPMGLKMTLYVTATPVTWHSRHGGGEARVRQVCDQLLALYESRELISVVTGDGSYENMVIKSISFKKSVSVGYAREIPVEFSQVTVTAARTTTVPESYARSGKTAQSAGSASTTKLSDTTSTPAGDWQSGSGGSTGNGKGSESTAKKGSTLLYNIANGIGNKTGLYSFGK